MGATGRVWSRFATQDGTGVVVGTNAAAVGDFSTPDDFYIEPQGSEVLLVARMIFHLRDAGALDAEKYGNGITIAAGDGVSLIVSQGGVETEDLTGGVPINTNAGWRARCYDAEAWTIGTGDNYITARWTFTKHGAPIRLMGGDKLIVRVDGDFTNLIEHTFLFEGVYENIKD